MNSTPFANLRKTSLALAVVAAVLSGSAIAATSANSLVTVAQTTALRSGDAVTGAVPASQLIRVEVALKLRDRAGLESFIAHNAKTLVSHPMSHDQFMANHAPTQVQAQTVANYLKAMGYKNVVIAPNRMLVSADGTAASASKAFLTTFAQVRTREGRMAFANTSEARIPAVLQDHVLSVVGLQSVYQGHTFAKVLSTGGAHTNALVGHNPVEFSSIYGATGVATAAGVTVGIFTSGDVSQSITDLGTYTTQNSLAPVTTSVVTTNGGSSDTSGVDEWDLDSQDIVGIGGGQVGQLIFYTTPSLSFSDMVANFNTIVNANAAKIVNVSIGGCETGAQTTGAAAAADQIFSAGVAQGQTFSISTGDSGADECGDGGTTPSWPANSQYVIAAAGTTLDASTGATAAWNSETVWSGTGGSPSKYEPKPSWQDLLVPGNFRGVADIAFDADPNTGALIVVNGKPAQIGGTSLSAPLFAGMWARVLAVKGTDFGFAGPLIYALPQSDFHDVTVGNNGGESAKVGYDFATGRGSIILNTAINHIGKPVGQPPVANFSYIINGLKVTFTDTSTDSDGTIFKHFWNFGDGSAISTAANPSHYYAGAGTYQVSETVADNDLNTVTKTLPVTVTQASLIKNTGFETGIPPWVFSSPVLLNNDAKEPPHAGQWDAWLGGKGATHTDYIKQTATLPSPRTSGTLKYWLHIDSNEVSTVRKFDTLSVDVYSTGGTLLGNLAKFSNLDKASGYALKTADMTPWIGQTVVVKFTANEDASLQTSFVIDDVVLSTQ